MLTKQDLENLKNLKFELNNLEKRINNIKNKPRKILIDAVNGSSKDYPYTNHKFKIEGLDNSITYRKHKNTIKKLTKQYNQKKHKIDKELLRIEYELNYIEDSEIREIIRMRYIDDLNWIQIMFKKKYTSQDTARKKFERYLQK